MAANDSSTLEANMSSMSLLETVDSSILETSSVVSYEAPAGATSIHSISLGHNNHYNGGDGAELMQVLGIQTPRRSGRLRRRSAEIPVCNQF